jgi:protein ImuB
LTALLGADRVGTPVLEETHRPDAFRLEPFAWQVGAIDLNRPKTIKPMSRIALRRFRPAVSASVLLDADTPAHLRSTEISGKVLEQRGPYLISGNWWDEKSWARAEWDLEMENDELVRVHESPPSPSSGVASEGSWKVDGVYD